MIDNSKRTIGILAPIADVTWFRHISHADRTENKAPAGKIFGRPIVVASFIDAVIRYGRFNYSIFLPYRSPTVLRELNNRLETTNASVTLHSITELPEAMERGSIDLMHDPSGAEIYRLSLVRGLTHSCIPITGLIHSVGTVKGFYDDLMSLITGCFEGDTIVCPSQASADAIRKRIEFAQESLLNRFCTRLTTPRVCVIPLGIETESFKRLEQDHARRTLGLPPNACIGLYIGRFSPTDKADLIPLLRAFLDARKQSSDDIRLLLVGDDRQENYGHFLQQWANVNGLSDGVTFHTDPVFGHEKLVYLSAADFFISPIDNAQETFGLTLLEAMATGLPVIATDMGGYRDIVRDNVDGFLIPSSWVGITKKLDSISLLMLDAEDGFYISQGVNVDIQAMTESILAMANSDRQRRRMGEHCIQRAREVFDWKQVISAYENMWENLILDWNIPSKNHQISSIVEPSRENILINFPSCKISVDNKVQTTALGLRVVSTGILEQSYSELQGFLPTYKVISILRQAKSPCSVHSILCGLGDGIGESLVPREFIVIWLIKHGYLRLTK